MGDKLTLAVDFDGVIHDPNNVDRGKRMGNPIEGARESMKSLRNAGHTLIIFTVNDTRVVKEWLKYWRIHFDSVTSTKPSADIYIDDRALRFNDWTQALSDIQNWKVEDE